jgi:hypothetical protein
MPKINIQYQKDPQVLFDYLFTTSDSLKERNKKVFMFIDSNLRADKLTIVQDFINDPAIKDLHVSLLKSALLMTENIEGISAESLSVVYKKKIGG